MHATILPTNPFSKLLLLPITKLLSCVALVAATAPLRSFASAIMYTTRSGGTITIAPNDESKQNALVVICHGLGDSAEGFVDVAENLATVMPHCKFVLPTAPTRPVTMNMNMPMPAWYDIVGLDERANENCPGIEESVETLRGILQKEHEATGLPYSRMMLSGFSMGGALSLFTGMSMPDASQKLAGICALSGYLVGAKKFQMTSGLESTPIFHGHGTADPLVQYTMATKSREYLLEHGATDYELKPYQGMPHTVKPEEIADWVNFMQRVLPDDETCKVKLKDPKEMSVKELKESIKRSGLGSKAVGLMEKSEFVKLLQDHRSGNL